jgi:hypothetical protein
MIDEDTLDLEHKELIDYWKIIFVPSRKCSSLLDRLYKRKDMTLLSDSICESSGFNIRKIHDVFGWCAKKDTRCAGAIYRTEQFMAITPLERDGSKPRKKRWPRNIHIEHTVLASQIHEMWRKPENAEISKAHDVLIFFLTHGVATAISRNEEITLGGGKKPNPCFDGEAKQGNPFKRYAHLVMCGTKIWNVYTRREIKIERYTIAEHEETIMKLLEEAKAPPSLWQHAVKEAQEVIAEGHPL